jgi:hypothetical protein
MIFIGYIEWLSNNLGVPYQAVGNAKVAVIFLKAKMLYKGIEWIYK